MDYIFGDEDDSKSGYDLSMHTRHNAYSGAVTKGYGTSPVKGGGVSSFMYIYYQSKN